MCSTRVAGKIAAFSLYHSYMQFVQERIPTCVLLTSYRYGATFVHAYKAKQCLSFPAATKPRRLSRTRMKYVQTFNVYCTCRLIWNKNQNIFGNLAKCGWCKEWFHQQCQKFLRKYTQNHLTTGCVVHVHIKHALYPCYT